MKIFNLKFALGTLAALYCGSAFADPASLIAIASHTLFTVGTVAVTVGTVLKATVLVYGATRQRSKAKKAMAAARASAKAAMQDRYATILTATPPLQTVYGRATVGSSIHAMFTSNKVGQRSDGSSFTRRDAIHHLVYVFTCHEISAVNDIKVNGQSCYPLDASGYSLNSAFRMPTASARYAEVTLSAGASYTSAVPILSATGQTFFGDNGPVDATGLLTIAANRLSVTNNSPNPVTVQITYGDAVQSAIRIHIHTGSPTQTVNTMLNTLFPDKWTTNHRIRGRFYIVASIDLEFPGFQSGPPEIVADVNGKLVYDPRTATTVFSANNVNCIADYLRSSLGAGAALADINSSYWIAGANACDVSISVREDSYTDSLVFAMNTNGNQEGWTGANGAGYVVGSGGFGTLTHTGPDGFMTNATFTPFAGSGRRYVRMRIRRTQGQGWRGVVQYATGAHSYTDQFQKRIEAGLALNVWTELVWDMHSLDNGGPDWKNNTVQGIRILLGSDANDRFDIDWIALSSYSEVSVSRPKYTMNGVVSSDMDRERILSDMADSMAGFVYNTGEWIIVPGYWTASVQTVGDNDLDGSISVIRSDTPWEDLFNSCRAIYYPIGATSGVDMEPAYVNSTLVGIDGKELWADIALPFTNTAQRARNLSRIRVEQSRNGQVLRIPLQLTGLRLRVGDRFTLNNAEYGIVNKIYRVTDYALDTLSPVSIIAEEDTPETYNEADLLVGDPTPNSYLPPPYLRVPVTGIQVFSGTQTMNVLGDGTAQSRVQVVWNPPTDTLLLSGDGMLLIEWRIPLRDAPDAWRETLVPADAGSAYLVGPQGGEVIVLRLRFRTSSIASSELRYATHIVQEVSTGAFTATRAWTFNTGTTEGWTATGATFTGTSSGIAELRSSGSDPILLSPTLSLTGQFTRRIRMRVMRVAGSGWQGQVYYSPTPAGSFSESYTKTLVAVLPLNQWVILEWDMYRLTAGGIDWSVRSPITQLRFDLGNSASDQFWIDWIAVGYVGPGTYGSAWSDVEGVPVNVQSATSDVTLVADGAVSVSGNIVVKTGGTSAYDASARSTQSYYGGCHAECVPQAGNIAFLLGINADPATDAGYVSIDYAIHGNAGGLLYAYQSGTALNGGSPIGGYSAGDVLAVNYNGYRVSFVKNGVALLTVVPPAAYADTRLYLDTSLFTPGAELRNVRFVPLSQVSGLVVNQIATAAQPDLLNSYQIIGQNLFPESDQMVMPRFGLDYNPNGAVFQTISGGPLVALTDAVPGWTTADYVLQGGRSKLAVVVQIGRHTGTVDTGSDGAGNTIAVVMFGRPTSGIPVVPGRRYAASIYGNGHRCSWRVALGFYNSSNAWVTALPGQDFPSPVINAPASVTNTLDTLTRSTHIAVAPPGASVAVFMLAKYNTRAGEPNSYLFFGMPQLEEIASQATGASPYSSGPVAAIGTDQIVAGSATDITLGPLTAFSIGQSGNSAHDRTETEATRAWTNSGSRAVKVHVIGSCVDVFYSWNGDPSTVTHARVSCEYSVSGGGGSGASVMVDRAPPSAVVPGDAAPASGAAQFEVTVNPGATITATIVSRHANTTYGSIMNGYASLSITSIKL